MLIALRPKSTVPMDSSRHDSLRNRKRSLHSITDQGSNHQKDLLAQSQFDHATKGSIGPTDLYA